MSWWTASQCGLLLSPPLSPPAVSCNWESQQLLLHTGHFAFLFFSLPPRMPTPRISKAVSLAAQLKPEIRLAQAVSEFVAALSSEQKAAFSACRSQSLTCPPNGRDVMRLTAEIDRSASRIGTGGRCFGPRLTNVLQAVQQFAALGDLIVGGSQNVIACGVWSLVRLTLLVRSLWLPWLCLY
jgi:hypothetical protein